MLKSPSRVAVKNIFYIWQIKSVAVILCWTPALEQSPHELHWLPVCFRVQFKVLVTFKALYGLGLGYLWDHLFPRVSTHPTRLRKLACSRSPWPKNVRWQGPEAELFLPLPYETNTLLSEIRTTPTLLAFHKSLTMFLSLRC